MQYLDVAILGAPGLLIGIASGYFIGGMEDLNFNTRFGLGVIISFFGGMITSLLFLTMDLGLPITITTYEVILIILSFFGGYILGAIANWAPLPEKPPKRHVIFEPSDEEDFDREIEEAMGGDFKANNS
ncbi:MAG: hypothetical protein AM326_04245 [Candidatus Thorarchaeota archaeon SMTZ-45]|nr:MAG: hypothetical protein AM326_04245 [Candidatus Thorarchaeota archaeon SMTZ-45]KXH74509.1 MAG: hypothetical protein AM325_05905 [Candidatus Thorarchaeota archaeon SMTZ1-45]